jgi:hypothetical protein
VAGDGVLTAVSTTCAHPDAEAALYPGCEGCAALVARLRLTVGEWCPALSWRAEDDALGRMLLKPVRLSLLPDRPLTPEDRAAHDEEPRPGVWAAEVNSDLRALTQHQTDALIRLELVLHAAAPSERDEIRAMCGGEVAEVRFDDRPDRPATLQRGGLDSDPMVRLLAYRAWGDRDRQWFELRGVRKGEVITVTGREMLARAWDRDTPRGHALEDGRPGDVLPMVTADGHTTYGRVSDRLRVDPAQPRALTPDEAGIWSLRCIDAAASYFATVGIQREHMWVENDGTTQTLWSGPSGKQSPADLRLVLARTWVEAGELRYEGPEVDLDSARS